MSKPINHCKRWSKEENQKLIEELSSGMLIEDMCRQHGRSDGSIRSRIREIAYNMHIDGKTITEIKTITNLDDNFILEVIAKKNKYGKKPQDKKDMLETSEKIAEEKHRNIDDDERDMLEIIEDFKLVNERVERIGKLLSKIDFSLLKSQILRDVILSMEKLDTTISVLRSKAGDVVSRKTITNMDEIKEKFVSNHDILVSLLDKLEITN
jgi:transposase-like protein